MASVDKKLDQEWLPPELEGLRSEINVFRALFAEVLATDGIERKVVYEECATRFHFQCRGPETTHFPLLKIWARYAEQIDLAGRCVSSTAMDPLFLHGQLLSTEVYKIRNRTLAFRSTPAPADEITLATSWVTARTMEFAITITISGEKLRACFDTIKLPGSREGTPSN